MAPFTRLAAVTGAVVLPVVLAVGVPWLWAQSAPAEPKTSNLIQDETNLLPWAQECTVLIEQGESTYELHGRLKQAGAEWLVISARSEAPEVGVPMLTKLPHTNRFFKNVGAPVRSQDYWIPRQRIVYLCVRNRENDTSGDSLNASAPQQELDP
jgi:hypothetical protein